MGFAALDEIEMREAVHRLRAALDASRKASRPRCVEHPTSTRSQRSGLCFTLCGIRAMLHAWSRDGIRKDGKISGLGAGAEAEGLDCRAQRSRLDRLVGQPRRRGLSNLWYGVQFPAWLVCPVSSGLAGARDVGLDPGHAEGRRPAPGATLHMS
jgi:hypothetical protein